MYDRSAIYMYVYTRGGSKDITFDEWGCLHTFVYEDIYIHLYTER